MTNVFSSLFQNQVIGILKGNWSLRRKTKGFHSVTHPSPSLKAKGPDFVFGIILTHLFMTKGEENSSRALMIPFLAIHAKGGESISPKQKDRTTTLIFKINDFPLVNFKLVSLCVLKGEKVVFSKLIS